MQFLDPQAREKVKFPLDEGDDPIFFEIRPLTYRDEAQLNKFRKQTEQDTDWDFLPLVHRAAELGVTGWWERDQFTAVKSPEDLLVLPAPVVAFLGMEVLTLSSLGRVKKT